MRILTILGWTLLTLVVVLGLAIGGAVGYLWLHFPQVGPPPALTITLDEPIMNEINAIWPGPGNQAPEAYAW